MTVFPILFFLSFVFSVVNVSINGASVYFYMAIPLMDVRFIRWFIHERKNKKLSIYFVLLCFFLVIGYLNSGSILGLIKPILLFLSVSYCMFLYSAHYKQFKLLYYFTAFSVVFACIQFVLSNFGVGAAFEPTNIGEMLWGQYAIQTRSGFDDGLLFQYRVSGLSKEPGFFSSLLLSCLVLYVVDKKYRSKYFISLVCIGLTLSMSKITIAFAILVPFVYLFDKFIFSLKKINLVFGGVIYLVLLVLIVNTIYSVTNFISVTYASPYFAETYLHRSIGMYLLGFPMNPVILNSILFGGITQNISAVLQYFPFLYNLKFVQIQPDVVFFSSSGAYILLQYGMGVYLSYLLFLRVCRVEFFSFLIFSIITSSVNYFAFENWVLLGYVFMFVNSQYAIGNHDNKS